MTDRPTTTFDLGDGQVEDTTFTDIDSSADRLLTAQRSSGNIFTRIRHEPFRTTDGVNWTKVGALGTLATVVLAMLTLAVMLLLGG